MQIKQTIHFIFFIILFISGIFISGCASQVPGVKSSPKASNPDTTLPTVSSTTASQNNSLVAVNAAISVTFSEPIDPSTIDTTTFTIASDGNIIGGKVTCNETTATFTPSAPFDYSKTFSATITTGVKDLAGNPMANNYSWTFTTGTAPDTTSPDVSSTTPDNNDTVFSVNTAIAATFTEPLEPSTVTTSTFILASGSTYIPGKVTYNGITATLTPLAPLDYSKAYTAAITTGVKDLAGNPMAKIYSWTFVTGTAPDTTAPEVSSTTPANNSTLVDVTGSIIAKFTEPLEPSAITTATFKLSSDGFNIPGTVTYNGTTATFTPSAYLDYSKAYTAAITTGVKDLAGNPMAKIYSWNFTTTMDPLTIPPDINLAGLSTITSHEPE